MQSSLGQTLPLPRAEKPSSRQFSSKQPSLEPSTAQPYKIDANALVALTTECTEGHDIKNRWREDGFYSANGIVDDLKANIRTIPILDAIASIAIYEPKEQVVAVAFQQDNKRKQIRLTVAQNDDVPKMLIDHIIEVWKMLRELSDECASTIDRTIFKRKKDAIITKIYKFSERNLIARAEKWRIDFFEFSKAFIRAFKQGALGDSTDKELQEDLIGVITGLYAAFGWTDGQDSKPTCPIQNWKIFIAYMWLITGLVDKILENTHVCETWVNEVNGRLAKSKLCTYHRCNV
jgi:hypothetical protein